MGSLHTRLLFLALLSCPNALLVTSIYSPNSDSINDPNSSYNRLFPKPFAQRETLPYLAPQFLPDDEKIREQTGLDIIQLSEAWDISTGSQEVIIAVIDDAIEINHPDLSDNMLAGWDFVDGDNDPSPGQCFDPATQTPIKESHGTSVTGIIAAVGNNQLGVAGVNWHVKILPIRIGCTYSPAYESRAVAYAISQGAHIINASYAGPEFLYRNQEVIQQLTSASNQVLFVTSAGNLHTNNDISPMYPGNLTLPNVISVASINSSRQLSHWSQYGSASVDIAAPGEQVLTTLFNTGTDNDYGSVSGTSFSTAIVSGIAGLIKAEDLKDGSSDLTPGDMKGILLSSATALNKQKAYLKTDGIVNALNALQSINLKQPVVIINSIVINDAASSLKNAVIDSNETFTLELELQNLWDDIYGLQLELVSGNNLITVIENTIPVDYWPKNTNKTVNFNLQSGSYTGLQNFPFTLRINATGTERNSLAERHFALQSGLLANNVQQSDTIQQTFADETRSWHFNIPAEANKVAIELERSQLDDRKLGVLSSIGENPQIFFRESGGSEYTALSDHAIYSNDSYERLDFNVASLKAETVKLLVFNKATNFANENAITNKNYRIKACYFTENDGNKAPLVDAGRNLIVDAGETVVLTGTFSDEDGEITRSWWSTDAEINFTVESANKISFTAPQSGSVTFVLTAVDNECRKTADSVTISINEDNSGDVGLQINPKRIVIEEGSVISVQVSANYQDVPVTDLRFISGPEGLIFEKNISQDAFDRIIWQNTGAIGVYSVLFSAEVNGNILEGSIIIEIKKRGGKSSGSGCSLGKSNQFDPVFIFCLLISVVHILKRKPSCH